MKSNLELSVAAIQMISGTNVGDNLQQAADLVASAANAGARLIVLPEYFCFLGHRPEDKLAIAEEPGHGPIQDFLSVQARQHGVSLVGGTLPLKSPDTNRVFNTCFVYGADGSALLRYDKLHLFGFKGENETYDESLTIHPGEPKTPFFQLPFGRIGLGICYDLRFPEFFRQMLDVRLIVLPAAFTWTTGSAHWEVLLRARAIENQCYVLASAQGGQHQNGRRTWGHSMLIDPWGQVLSCLPEGRGVVSGVLSAQRMDVVRQSLPAWQDRVLHPF